MAGVELKLDAGGGVGVGVEVEFEAGVEVEGNLFEFKGPVARGGSESWDNLLAILGRGASGVETGLKVDEYRGSRFEPGGRGG